MSKNVLFLILYLLLSYSYSYGQLENRSTAFSSKSGIIVFEGKGKIYEMYFIETAPYSFLELLKKKDTIIAILLGSPGDDVSNTEGFKSYLEKSIRFDSTFLLISDTNHLGYGYEDTTSFHSKYGTIKYVNSKGYKLSLKYKKVYLKAKPVVIVSENYVPIDSFTKAPIFKKRNAENNSP